MKEIRRLLLMLFGCLAVSAILYGNTIRGQFVYDDSFISTREELRETSHLSKLWTEPFLPKNVTAGVYKPIPVFTFSLNFLLFGESTTSFHITNIVLNGLTIFLVWLVTWQLFGNPLLAVFSAALFAFFPIHTETVANIKSRDEILAALFGLSAWSAFLRATKSDKIDPGLLALSAVLVLGALLSKEFAIAIPVIILAIHWIKLRPSVRGLVKLSLPYVGAVGLYLLLRIDTLAEYAFRFGREPFVVNPLVYTDFWTRFWTAGKIAFLYISKTFIPWKLSATYHYNHLTVVHNPFTAWQTAAGFSLLGILIYLLINRRIRVTPVGIGTLIFLLSYFVFSKFIFPSGDIVAERWMYFPSVGFALIGGQGFVSLFNYRKEVALVIMAILLSMYAWITITRNTVWLSQKSLYESMIASAPDSVTGHVFLADTYFDEGKYEEGTPHLLEAATIYQDYPPVLNLEGVLAYRNENYELANQLFHRSLEISPGEGRTIVLYALSLSNIGRYEESNNLLEPMFWSVADNPLARFVMAVNLYKLGNPRESHKYFDAVPGKTEEDKITVLEHF